MPQSNEDLSFRLAMVERDLVRLREEFAYARGEAAADWVRSFHPHEIQLDSRAETPQRQTDIRAEFAKVNAGLAQITELLTRTDDKPS